MVPGLVLSDSDRRGDAADKLGRRRSAVNASLVISSSKPHVALRVKKKDYRKPANLLGLSGQRPLLQRDEGGGKMDVRASGRESDQIRPGRESVTA